MAILSPSDIRRILRNSNNDMPVDDFRLIDSWTEYEEGQKASERTLEYLCYEIEVINPDTGEAKHLYKAIKLLRVERLPRDAKESLSLMDMHTQVLTAIYEQQYNFITVIANIIEPEPLGLLFLYGVQGVSPNLETAKQKAHDDYVGLIAILQGTYRVMHFRSVIARESEWLREKMFSMSYMTMVRGIPKANMGGENAGNKGIGNTNINPNSQGTIEEIIAGMVDYEYVIQVLSTPVYMATLKAWQTQTQMDMTLWNSQLQGTKSISANVSIPMMYMANASTSQGWSHAYTDAESISISQGESFTTSVGQSIGESLSKTFGQSFTQTQGVSVSDSVSQSSSVSIGNTTGQSLGVSRGISENFGTNSSIGTNSSVSHSNSESFGVNSTVGQSTSIGQSIGQSLGQTVGHTVGQTQSQTIGQTTGQTLGQTAGVSSGVSHNVSSGVTDGVSHTDGTNSSSNWSNGTNVSHGTNAGYTQGYSQGMGASVSDGTSHSEGGSFTDNHSQSDTNTNGWNVGGSATIGSSVNGGVNILGISAGGSVNSSLSVNGGVNGSHAVGTTDGYSIGSNYNNGQTHTESLSLNESVSNSTNMGVSDSIGHSSSVGGSTGVSQSDTTSHSVSNTVSDGTSQSNSFSQSMSNSISNSLSQGVSNSVSDSVSNSMTNSLTNSITNGYSESFGNSHSVGSTTGMSNGVSQSQGVSQSIGSSTGQTATNSNSQSVSQSNGVTIGSSVGRSQSTSVGQSASVGTSQSATESNTISQGTSVSKGSTSSNSISNGTSGTFTTGSSGSMGLAPSIGYNKSYQWLDQQVKDILELYEFQNERLKYALRGSGAFYTYVYIACSSMDALSAARALAKSTWQNEFAMTQPVQVLDLSPQEQRHLLYHFSAFSADVTRETVMGVQEWKYSTILLPKEFVAYTHLPRISEGGVFAEVNDVPKFAAPSMMKGEIYMGSIVSAERYSFKNGYITNRDFRIPENQLMHGYFSGASRSGKTVAAMRFVAELTKVRRRSTGKRLRIVCMDPKSDWRALARFVEPERFRFFSMGNPNFHPLHFNPCKIPKGVPPQIWVDVMIEIYCRVYGLLERGKQLMAETFYSLYQETGVFDCYGKDGWEEMVPELSANVTFAKAYERMNYFKMQMEDGTSKKGRGGNDTKDAYARLLERLAAFSRPFSIESRLFGQSDGLGIDEIIGEDDVTVLESKGLESTFRSFIFGVITAGFYRYAIAQEGGFLAKDQYETVLVIEEANEVLTGSDTAGTGNSQMGLSGQSEFEQILDQSAGYGLFIFAITQKIADMPKSIIANAGLIFAGKIKTEDDINVIVKSIAKDPRYDDRDVAKWFPRSPTGWFICQSSRTSSFIDAEPIMVRIAMLPISRPTNAELDDILQERETFLQHTNNRSAMAAVAAR